MSNSQSNAGSNADLTSRRRFMRTAALIASTATLAPLAANAASMPAMLPESDPIAQALGYRADANTVDTTKYPTKAGDEQAPQLCSNCSLYKRVGDGVGSCAAIPGKLVAGPGWCSAWNPAR